MVSYMVFHYKPWIIIITICEKKKSFSLEVTSEHVIWSFVQSYMLPARLYSNCDFMKSSFLDVTSSVYNHFCLHTATNYDLEIIRLPSIVKCFQGQFVQENVCVINVHSRNYNLEICLPSIHRQMFSKTICARKHFYGVYSHDLWLAKSSVKHRLRSQFELQY